MIQSAERRRPEPTAPALLRLGYIAAKMAWAPFGRRWKSRHRRRLRLIYQRRESSQPDSR